MKNSTRSETQTERQIKTGRVLINLFIIHLEHALKEIRRTLPRPTSLAAEIPNEVAYADDVDFIEHSYADIKKIQKVQKKIPA